MGQFNAASETIDGLPILKKPAPTEIDGLPILKKKDSTPVLPSGVHASGGGLNISLDSPAPTKQQPYTVVQDPKLREKLQKKDEDDAGRELAQNTHDVVTRLNKEAENQQNLQNFMDKLSPEEKDKMFKLGDLSRQLHSNDALREVSPEEWKSLTAMDSTAGRVAKSLTHIGSQGTKGLVDIAKGGAWVLNHLNSDFVDTEGQGQKDFWDKIDKFTDFGLTPTQKQQVEDMRVGGIKLPGVAGDVANILPTAIAGEETGLPKLFFALQGAGMGKTAIDQAKKDGHDVNPYVEDLFVIGNMAANGYLMGDLGENIFGKMPARLRGSIVNEISAEALRNATSEATFKELLNKGTKDFSDKLQTLGIKYLTNFRTTTTDLGALNVANWMLRKGVDIASDKPVFNADIGGLEESLKGVAQMAPLFATFGTAPQATKLLPYTDFKNDIVEHIADHPDQADNIKQDMVNYGVQKGWTPEEIKATNEHITQIADAASKLPENVNPKHRVEAIQLIQDRDKLQGELDKETAKKEKLDPAVRDIPTQIEQYLTDKIDQANDKLRSYVTGKRTTYSKGTGDEEGSYFKTTDKEKEEITPDRYELERTERDLNETPKESEQKGGPDNAIQIEKPDEGVLREEGSSVGLQEVGERNTEQKESAAEGKPQEEVKPEAEVPKEGAPEKKTGGFEKFTTKQKKAGDPLRDFASKVRDGKISKLGGFRSGTLFDKAWDGSLEAVATALDGGAKLADAIEEGLKHIRGTKWYQKLKNKQDFEKQYTDHLNSEFNKNKPTGIKHAATRQERAESGFKPYDKNKDRSPEAIDAEGKRRVDENPTYADQVARNIINDPRPASDAEQAAMLYKHVQLKNEKRSLLKSTDEKNRAENEQRIAQIEDEQLRLLEASDIGGSELGSGLGYRNTVMSNDYSTETILKRAKMANAGENVSKEDADFLKSKSQRIEELEDKLAEREDRIRELQEENQVLKVKKASEYEARKAKRDITQASLKKERGEIIAELEKLGHKAAGELGANKIPFEMAAPLAKLARNYVLSGITTLEGVVDAIYQDLKKIIPDANKDEITTQIQGEFDKYLEEHEKLRLSDAKERAQRSIKDLKGRISRKEYKKPTKPGVTPDEELNSMREQIKKHREELRQIERDEKGGENAVRLEKAKGKLSKKLEDLKKVEAGKTPEQKVREKLQYDNEYLDLQKQIKDQQRAINGRIEKIQRSKESLGRRILDVSVKYGRQSKLGSIVVLGKLMATGLATMGVTAAQEGIGKGFSKLLPKTAKKSTVEGAVSRKALRAANQLTEGKSIKSLSQAYARAATLGIKDAYQELGLSAFSEKRFGGSTGSSELSALYSKYMKSKLPPEAAEFFGHLHSAIKAPVKRFAWEHSYAKRVAKMMEQGIDPRDPVIDATNRMLAYKDAERAIFMGDNVLSKVYEMGVTYLENRQETSTGMYLGRGGAAMLRILIPFVKVPTNIMFSTGRYVGGIPMGAGMLGLKTLGAAAKRVGGENVANKISNAQIGKWKVWGAKNVAVVMKHAMKELTPEQADMVLRNFKRGSIGGAALMMGFFNPKAVGGYYQKGEHRAPDEANEGALRIFGHKIPAWLTEHPVFQAMQIGATYRRVLDAHMAKDDASKAAMIAVATGVMEHIPLGEESKQFTDIMDPNNTHKFDKFIVDAAKGELEPAAMQQIAQALDVKPGEETTIPGMAFDSDKQQKRNPDKYHGFWQYMWESMKTGIPGVRKSVQPKAE